MPICTADRNLPGLAASASALLAPLLPDAAIALRRGWRAETTANSESANRPLRQIRAATMKSSVTGHAAGSSPKPLLVGDSLVSIRASGHPINMRKTRCDCRLPLACKHALKSSAFVNYVDGSPWPTSTVQATGVLTRTGPVARWQESPTSLRGGPRRATPDHSASTAGGGVCPGTHPRPLPPPDGRRRRHCLEDAVRRRGAVRPAVRWPVRTR
jgi:hypothetical protein